MRREIRLEIFRLSVSRRSHYMGASQGDIANFNGEDLDWTNNPVSFARKKTGVPVVGASGRQGVEPV